MWPAGRLAWSLALAFLVVLSISTPLAGRQRLFPEKAGTKAPSITGTTLDGAPIRLDQFRGSVLVLNFWYIACGGCRTEIPELNQLVSEFAGQPVVFLAFALDSPEKLRLFLAERPFRYTHVANAEPIVESFGVSGFPTHIVIDRRGTITHFGSGNILTEHLRPVITAALKQ
jgi:peroxiredoxin